MSAWPEASYAIDEIGKKIDSKPSGNVSVIRIATTNSDWIGETATVTNGHATYTATLEEKTVNNNTIGYAEVEVSFIGDYSVTVDDTSEYVAISTLGQIKDMDIEPYHLYGYKKAKADSNPSARITYTDGAEGFTPLTRNFEDDSTDLGSWEGTFILNAFRPVMLQSNGTVAYELDHEDQTKRIDGVTASDISNTSFDGNAMVGVKTIWLNRYEDEDYEYVQFCDKKISNDFKAYAHTGSDGETILEEIYLPMFEGSSVSSKVRSLAGQTPMNTQTGATEKTQIEANGSGWQFDDHANRELVRDVLTLLGKSTNCQAVYGQGHTSGGTGAGSLLQTGTLKSKGAFSGANNNAAVKVLWLENYWGDRWDRCYGVIYDTAGKIKVKMHPPYNTDGAGYINTGVSISGTNGGYIKTTSMTEYGMLPKDLSGSETTYECDGTYYDTTQSNFLLRGGRCGDAARCGFACWHVSDLFSASGWGVGPSLSYKQPAAA